MKKLFVSLAIAASVSLSAQWTMPWASPRQTVEQQFSISKITIDYGRPAVKGRKIFGGLVPYGQVWRAGANSSTKIEFRQPVLFGGSTVPAGRYGLYILPTEKEWKVILNADSQSWGTEYDAKKDLYTATVPVLKSAERQEYFEISLEPVDDNTANLVFSWDFAKAVLPVRAANPEFVGKIVQKLKEIHAIERAGEKD